MPDSSSTILNNLAYTLTYPVLFKGFVPLYGPFPEYHYVIFTIKSPLDKLHPKGAKLRIFFINIATLF